VQGNITFSGPQEVSVVSAGFLRVASRRVTTMFFDTPSADIGEVLPVGYQVTSLLWELLWLSVGQDSHLPTQPVLHVIHIHDSSIPLRRLDTYTPVSFSRLTGFMGSPSIADTDLTLLGTLVDCYLRPPFMSEITSVALARSQGARGVMGHTPLPLCPPSGLHRYESWLSAVLELGVTLVRLSD